MIMIFFQTIWTFCIFWSFLDLILMQSCSCMRELR